MVHFPARHVADYQRVFSKIILAIIGHGPPWEITDGNGKKMDRPPSFAQRLQNHGKITIFTRKSSLFLWPFSSSHTISHYQRVETSIVLRGCPIVPKPPFHSRVLTATDKKSFQNCGPHAVVACVGAAI